MPSSRLPLALSLPAMVLFTVLLLPRTTTPFWWLRSTLALWKVLLSPVSTTPLPVFEDTVLHRTSLKLPPTQMPVWQVLTVLQLTLLLCAVLTRWMPQLAAPLVRTLRISWPSDSISHPSVPPAVSSATMMSGSVDVTRTTGRVFATAVILETPHEAMVTPGNFV